MLNKKVLKYCKYQPVALSLLAVSVFGAIIGKHEYQLQNSQPIYIELAPLDPRSIIQGDYMTLRYELYLDSKSPERSTGFTLAENLINQHKIKAFVALDNDRKIVSTNLQKKDSRHNVPVIVKNPRNYYSHLYIASNSYMFAEGLADCYETAKYAKIMIDPQGNAQLKSLVSNDLQELNCEAHKSWWHKEQSS